MLTFLLHSLLDALRKTTCRALFASLDIDVAILVAIYFHVILNAASEEALENVEQMGF